MRISNISTLYQLSSPLGMVVHQILLSRLENWVGIQGVALEQKSFVFVLELLSLLWCLLHVVYLRALYLALLPSPCPYFFLDLFSESMVLLSISMLMTVKSSTQTGKPKLCKPTPGIQWRNQRWTMRMDYRSCRTCSPPHRLCLTCPSCMFLHVLSGQQISCCW